jgi:hypothetical protein
VDDVRGAGVRRNLVAISRGAVRPCNFCSGVRFAVRDALHRSTGHRRRSLLLQAVPPSDKPVKMNAMRRPQFSLRALLVAVNHLGQKLK